MGIPRSVCYPKHGRVCDGGDSVNPATGLDRMMDALLISGHPDEAVAIALRVSVGMVRKRRLALGLPAQSQRARG